MQCVAVLHEARGAPGNVKMDQRSSSGLKEKASGFDTRDTLKDLRRTRTFGLTQFVSFGRQ